MYPKAQTILERMENADNRSVLIRYIEYRLAVMGSAPATQVKQACHLRKFAEYIDHQLKECTTDDIILALNHRRGEVTPATYSGELKTIKTFLRWLKKQGAPFDIDVLSEIHNPQPPMTVRAEDLLQKDEIAAMIQAAKNSRDRLIIALLYDSAGRVAETIHDMYWGSLVFDKYGVILNLSGKTGITRYVRLSGFSLPYLQQWRADYPLEITDTAPLFPSRYGRNGEWRNTNISTDAVRVMLRRCAADAGIRRRVYPHLLRHTRITDWGKEHVPPTVILMLGWGDPYSDMLRNYTHLMGSDVDECMLQHFGLKEKKEEEKKAVVYCPQCRTIVSPFAQYCSVCGQPLTEDCKRTASEVEAEVMATREYLEELQRQITELRELVMGR